MADLLRQSTAAKFKSRLGRHHPEIAKRYLKEFSSVEAFSIYNLTCYYKYDNNIEKLPSC